MTDLTTSDSDAHDMHKMQFLAELKGLVLQACDKSEPAGGLSHDEELFGPASRLGLDSLDALQISMTIQKRYGVRMPDSKETRRALVSLNTLASHLQMRMG